MTTTLLLFQRLVVRALLADPVRTALTLLAVALGVGVVVAIELAGTAAAGSFRSSLETLTGDTDLEITAIGGVDEEHLGTLATLPWPIEVSPRVEGYAVVNDSGATVPLLGLDLVRQQLPGAGGSGEDHFEALQDPRAVWVSPALADGFISLTINSRTSEYTVRGVVDRGESQQRTVVMDIRVAQQALDRIGRLDRIEVRVPPQPALTQWIKRLKEVLPPDVEIAPRGARTEANQKMLAAFRWNLRVLSYIALVVGAFLIYNTIAVSVVRRRVEIGILRALGATRPQVVLAFLAEAMFFGLAGGAAGLLTGRLMAEGAVGMLSATVEALYVSSAPSEIRISPGIGLLGLSIGVLVALASALAPALEASRVEPVEAMARGRRDYQSRVHSRRNLALGLCLALAAALASAMPAVDGKPLFGYLAALLLIAASALSTPAIIKLLAGGSPATLRRILGVEAMLGARSLAGSLSRTAVLVGALSTAVAMMVSVGVMVGSFRETVVLWLDNQLQADLYLRPAGSGSADRIPTMPAGLADAIERLPGVAAVDRFRLYDISYNGRPALLGGGQTEWIRTYGRTSFLPGHDREAILTTLPKGDNVIVSEPFSNKHDVTAGNTIRLPLDGAERAFQVLGVYRDFSNERGYIIMDRQTLLRYLPDPAPSSVAVFLEPSADLERVRSRVEQAAAGQEVSVLTHGSLRRVAMRIFDRTFSITYALEAVAIAVAVVGIAGALLALVIDRRRELGVLRFLGASSAQIRRLILFEAGFLGLLANLVGLVLGLALSLILIFVINRQSFGWTIEFHLPVALLLAGLTVVYGATVISGLYPARVAARLKPIEVVHEE